MEQSLIIFKPDAVQRGIVGDIVSRFERAGFKIIGVKMIQPERQHYDEHYEGIGTLKTRKGSDIFEAQLASMQQGPVIAMVLEGVNAVERLRQIVGPTEPSSAQPGTIRGDFAHVSFEHSNKVGKNVDNLVHASADKKEADKEIKHWFNKDELHNYEVAHQKFTQPS